jgi:hypothetical protein
MGFYVRKSLKAGPFRFNLSKSGVGVSAGVPGFRVGTGPRGNYVHVGRGGVYYRASLGGGDARRQTRPTAPRGPAWAPEMSATEQVAMTDITGVTAVELAPTSADDLVQQLNAAAAVRMWWKLLLVIPIIGWAAAYWLRMAQIARASVVVFYEVEDDHGQWFEQIVSAWSALAQAAGVWRLTSEGALNTTHLRKVNAGASTLINRAAAVVGATGPRVLVTNIAVPSVGVGHQSLHFLPDRVLVRIGRRYSEVSYAQLNVHCSQTRFIESGRVPRDAIRVGTTWKYANVSGGPDRRYKNNQQLPILGYAELELGTSSGLRWTLQCSNLKATQDAATVLSDARAPSLAQAPVSPAPAQLLSDAERDRASERLRDAYLEGRLTESEYEECSGAALQARRQSELDACLEGIPAAPALLPRGVSPRESPATHRPQARYPAPRPEGPVIRPRGARRRLRRTHARRGGRTYPASRSCSGEGFVRCSAPLCQDVHSGDRRALDRSVEPPGDSLSSRALGRRLRSKRSRLWQNAPSSPVQPGDHVRAIAIASGPAPSTSSPSPAQGIISPQRRGSSEAVSQPMAQPADARSAPFGCPERRSTSPHEGALCERTRQDPTTQRDKLAKQHPSPLPPVVRWFNV